MSQLLTGMTAMSFVVAALFFLRFWMDTRDRLFGMFALAFFILALNRVALGLVGSESEVTMYLYVVRLIGFLMILLAIIDKNRLDKRR